MPLQTIQKSKYILSNNNFVSIVLTMCILLFLNVIIYRIVKIRNSRKLLQKY